MADCVPRQGADEVVPGLGVAGPRTRLDREEGVPPAQPGWSPWLAAMRAARTVTYMPETRYMNPPSSPRSTPCASRRGNRPPFRREMATGPAAPGGGLPSPRR